ncbi:MAG: flavin reductase [Erysipelotrichaceae bacterium]|nr:flavin reductase [Erysipelotrichaceae bacterium]
MNINVFEQFNKDWALVTAGDIDSFNTMTISWGTLGTIWNKDVCIVFVKPCRYTHEFMEKNDYFTVSFFEEEYKETLGLLGRISGRDYDKTKEANLSPIAYDKAVGFKEAKTTLVLKKIYSQNLDKINMPEDVVNKYYLSEEEHTMYIGEVVEIIEKH